MTKPIVEILAELDWLSATIKASGHHDLNSIHEFDSKAYAHWTVVRQHVTDLEAELAQIKERNKVLEYACSKMNDEVGQILGKALGCPWYKDDQKNFPGATEANGVFVGEHVAETLAEEAARVLARLKADHLALAERLACASEALTRAALRQYERENAAYRRGQVEMRNKAWKKIYQAPATLALTIEDLPKETP